MFYAALIVIIIIIILFINSDWQACSKIHDILVMDDNILNKSRI